MPRKSPWHSVLQSVHHDNTNCNIRQGTGGKPLCQECARLDNAGR
jgi:hypothetical protein